MEGQQEEQEGVNVKYLGWPEKFNETILLDEYNCIVQRQHPARIGGHTTMTKSDHGATGSQVFTRK